MSDLIAVAFDDEFKNAVQSDDIERINNIKTRIVENKQY